MKLKPIFDAITPQNIKDIPLLKDAMDIFIRNLEENAGVAIEIRKIFDKENNEIRENLLKIYLSSLYTVITNVQENKNITSKFQDYEGLVLKKNINEILNDEYFPSNKEFKQRVGTKLSIDYSYLLARYLQTSEFEESDFKLTEIKPFHFRSEGTIYRELYENVVKPLSHPLGFTYIYNRLITNAITDLFGVEKVYTINSLEVRCLDGYYDVFTSDSDDTNVKADFLSRVNPLTGQTFTEDQYNTYVTVYTNKVPETVNIETIDGNPYKEVRFEDGTLVKQFTNPIRVYYRNSVDEDLETSIYLKRYTQHCAMFMDYEEVFQINYSDEITQWLEQVNIGISDYTTTDRANDEILLLSIFDTVGYYFYSDDDQYLMAMDYIPAELDDVTQTVTGQSQIKYIGDGNPTGITDDYYIYNGDTADIDILNTDFTNVALWIHQGSSPKHEWYLITQG